MEGASGVARNGELAFDAPRLRSGARTARKKLEIRAAPRLASPPPRRSPGAPGTIRGPRQESPISRRILAAWLPWWPTERLVRRRPEARSHPFVTVAETRNRLVIAAANPLAARAGLAPGMSLADGRAVVPDLITRPANPAAAALALERLARWTNRFTPRVMPDGVDTIFLDIAGCEHLFGGGDALIATLRSALEDFGLTTRLALADTPGAAWALTHYGPGDPAIVPADASPSALRRTLADLPVAALRLSAEVAEALTAFGLRQIGTLFPLEPAELIRRFGMEPVRRLEQALGIRDEPITPLPPLPPREVRRAFPEPISTPTDIRAAVDGLLDELCQALARSGQGARQLLLLCQRVDGDCQSVAIGTSRPLRHRKSLMELFAEKLPRIAPGFGIEEMALAAEATEIAGELQTDWEAGTAGPSRADNAEALAHLLDRLGNRFGFDRIARPLPHQSWMPERACRDHANVRRDRPGATSDAPARSVAQRPPVMRWPEGRRRPLRLLSPPEPVRILALDPAAPGSTALGPADKRGNAPKAAEPIREHPPRESAILHRGQLRPLRKIEGPERLECEWWRGETWRRDYYLAEDEAGCRYWLYRETAGDDETQPCRAAAGAARHDEKPDRASAPEPDITPEAATASKWYLHGIFG